MMQSELVKRFHRQYGIDDAFPVSVQVKFTAQAFIGGEKIEAGVLLVGDFNRNCELIDALAFQMKRMMRGAVQRKFKLSDEI